jgi:flagellin-like hook-associated protein FlgL
MRVTDQQIYRLANLHIGNARAESVAAGEQVNTGIRVAHPWDDAGAAGLIARHAQDQARQKAVADGATQASEELGAVDSAMDQVTLSLTRAHELAVQLASDTYNATDRANGAVEVQQLLAAVVGQLNQRFGDRYVFGGMLDGAPPFDTGGNYLGDANVRQVEIAPGLMQDASIRADVAFKGAGGGIDVLTSLSALATALSTNDATQIRASVGVLADGLHQVSDFRSHTGAMMNVFDIAASTAKTFSEDAHDARSRLEDADIFEASTWLAAAQASLQATMSAAAQQFRLSLVDKF